MPHDPLKTLLRLRHVAVDEGRRALVARLDAAAAASEAVRQAELAITQEAERASQTEGGDDLVEAFAAWLPDARRRVTQALAVQEQSEADVARCRAELTACRSALESLEAVCASRQAGRDAAIARQEAQAIDEASARPRPDND